MSENTRSSAFRKIDVDQFNENFKDDEQPEFQASTAIPDESEITKLINQYPFYNFYPPTCANCLIFKSVLFQINTLQCRTGNKKMDSQYELNHRVYYVMEWEGENIHE